MGRKFADERKATQESQCFIRATAYDWWCGNSEEPRASVIATYTETGRSQISNAAACEPNWILFNEDCYFHITQRLTWHDANQLCDASGSALASIHSKAENDFIHFLTGGQSTWIGVVDLNAKSESPEDLRWTDNSPMNYRNWNGTSEAEASTKGAEWFTKNSSEQAPCLCKKHARGSSNLIQSSTAEVLKGVRDPVSLPEPRAVIASDSTPDQSLAQYFAYFLIKSFQSLLYVDFVGIYSTFPQHADQVLIFKQLME